MDLSDESIDLKPTQLSMKKILAYAVKLGASDIHLKVPRPPVVRIDGKIRFAGETPLTQQDMLSFVDAVHNVAGNGGRGIAIATAMGKMLAERTLGTAADELPLPPSPLRPLPLWSPRPATALLPPFSWPLPPLFLWSWLVKLWLLTEIQRSRWRHPKGKW